MRCPPRRGRWRKRIIVSGRKTLFILHCISNQSARRIGPFASAFIIARSENFLEIFFFGNGLVRTRNTINGFNPVRHAIARSPPPDDEFPALLAGTHRSFFRG